MTANPVSIVKKQKKCHFDIGNFILDYGSRKEGIDDNLSCKMCTRENNKEILDNFVIVCKQSNHLPIHKALQLFRVNEGKK